MQDREAAVKKHEKNETDVLLQKKQHELDTVVKQSNEKYKAMLAQQMDEKDQLQQCLETEWTEKLQKAIKAADKKAAADKEAALQKALGQYEEQRNAAIDKVKTEHRDDTVSAVLSLTDTAGHLKAALRSNTSSACVTVMGAHRNASAVSSTSGATITSPPSPSVYRLTAAHPNTAASGRLPPSGLKFGSQRSTEFH